MGNNNQKRSNQSQPIKKLTDDNIRAAARLWCTERAQAMTVYGRIEEWETSEVTDMSDLFILQTNFNDDIIRWDVSQVTNMGGMFRGATSFNQSLNRWEVSRVTNMKHMFCGATLFNKDLSGWDVSSVTYMSGMFIHATSFNQDLSGWDVSRVTSMSIMFYGATSFNQDLSGWDVSSVTDMSSMFSGATAFNQDLSEWDVSKVTKMRLRDMFGGAIPLELTLQRNMYVSSFFEGVYLDMTREERRNSFAGVFRWQRRRSYMLFLVNHGYLHSATVASNYEHQSTKSSSEVVPCDMIFEVEDIYRYICQFL